jgi:hypothetical protein
MVFSPPIFTELTDTQYAFVGDQAKNVKNRVKFNSTPLSKIWLSRHLFSGKLAFTQQNFIEVFYTEFYPNRSRNMETSRIN